MSKKNDTAFGIFTESIGLYFSNFGQFVKYMSFPVLGQFFGLLLVFLLTFVYTKNMPFLIEKYPAFDNFYTLILCAILVTLPGMIILLKAFWEYLVAYGAINSMLENMLKSGKVYDFNAHTELIKRRTMPFIGLWMLFGIFSLFAIIPFFWVPAGVCAVFFVLVFQVFTYEPELSPIGCVRKSFNLIKGHFLPTFLLMAGIGALTYFLIPQIGTLIFDKLMISNFFAGLCVPFVSELPVNDLNTLLAAANISEIKAEMIAQFFITTSLTQILIQYTLPIRSLLWGMWYKKLNKGFESGNGTTKSRKSSKKRPSEKLMEESNKKYSSKRLDKNILKRAMEKDDEEEA